jgi:predicted secreted hydrolase
MMRFLIVFVVLLAARGAALAQAPVTPFPVAPHNDVTIEWWYLNADLHTKSGRHLAVVGSFFRFGNLNGQVAEDSQMKVKQSHYLIYAVTDIDTKKHYTFSYGDKNTQELLQTAADLMIAANPANQRAQQLMAALSHGFPPPTRLISSPCKVSASPFDADYGPGNSVTAVRKELNTFKLNLSGGAGDPAVTLTFVGQKTPMLVNGDGNTGLRVRTDMKYVSLTRCKVSGTVETGNGRETATGEGWFDHQWGNSWTTQTAGWDWWGARLSNGTDILFFQQIDLKTGTPFFPCATFESADGSQVTTHNIVFDYDAASEWASPTGSTYPLNWTVSFPDQHVSLVMTPDMLDQEMPIIAGEGAIWEGSCSVAATVDGAAVPGVAYQELVGYNSRAVHDTLKPIVGK